MRIVKYNQAINEALLEEMRRDKCVCFMGEDIGVYHRHNGPCGVSTGLLKEFGEDRVIETPIAEQMILGSASGAAMCGLRPVVEIMQAEFLACGFEHVTFGASKCSAVNNGFPFPLVIRAPYGSIAQAKLMQAENVEAWFGSVPGIKIVMPSNPSDAKGLLKSAIRDNYPVLFLEHHDLYKTEGDVPEEEYLTPIGEAKVVKEGDDVTVITYGYVVFEALKAGEALAKKGINIEIIDLRTVKPFDEETVFKSIKKTGRAVIFHEARKTGGLGGEISACISEKAFDSLKAPVIRIGAADVPSNFPPTSKGLMERIGALFAK